MVTVEIFGHQYTLQGENPEHLHGLARHVDKQMREVAAQAPDLSRSTLAILASLNITNEMFRLRREQDQRIEAWDRAGDELIALLDMEKVE